jgi:outer membrane lipoprotein-sorting protein
MKYRRWHVVLCIVAIAIAILLGIMPDLKLRYHPDKPRPNENTSTTVSKGSGSSFECIAAFEAEYANQFTRKIHQSLHQDVPIRATFAQQTYLPQLNLWEQSRGSVVLQWPASMDWHYEDPRESRFVTRDDTGWFFQPSENSVIVDDSNSMDSVPLRYFAPSILDELLANRVANHVCRGSVGVLFHFSLHPSTTFNSLDIAFNLETALPAAMKVIDGSGNITEIVLKSITRRDASEADFSVSIPKGIDIIDRRKRVR